MYKTKMEFPMARIIVHRTAGWKEQKRHGLQEEVIKVPSDMKDVNEYKKWVDNVLGRWRDEVSMGREKKIKRKSQIGGNG